MTQSKNSIRNNFENKESRKAILKSALAEIEAEIGTIWMGKEGNEEENFKSKLKNIELCVKWKPR